MSGILLAAFFILVIIFRPGGIMGQRELAWADVRAAATAVSRRLARQPPPGEPEAGAARNLPPEPRAADEPASVGDPPVEAERR
ncbi:MAG: hypothetical protein C4343_05525 [Chloroflexota bacterium]